MQLSEVVRDAASVEDPTLRFERASSLIDELQRLIQELQAVRASAASELHAGGLSYKEIGSRLHLSPQRVAQLVNSPRGLVALQRAWAEIERKLALLGSYAEITADRRSVTELISALSEVNLLDRTQFDAALAVLKARNDAVHARRPVSDAEVGELLDIAIALAAQLELLIGDQREQYEASASPERQKAEALLRRVTREQPHVEWHQGRCDQCGRAIPVDDPSSLWVCSQDCRDSWMSKLYHYISPNSEEEARTRTPRVVPYWI